MCPFFSLFKNLFLFLLNLSNLYYNFFFEPGSIQNWLFNSHFYRILVRKHVLQDVDFFFFEACLVAHSTVNFCKCAMRAWKAYGFFVVFRVL